MRSNGGFTVGVHGTLQHMLALCMGQSVMYFMQVKTCSKKRRERKNAKIVLKLRKKLTWPVYKPFPFGLGKLDEESKTSLNVPFEWAFTPIRKCKKIKHANILEKIIRS